MASPAAARGGGGGAGAFRAAGGPSTGGPAGGGGTGGSLMSLMQMMGPQFESQYKLDIADAIISALMEAQQGKGA